MTKEHDGRTDFDFFIGEWIGHNRRLKKRFKGSTSWEEFEGHSVAPKILGGLGHMDEVSMERKSGRLEGYTLRSIIPKRSSGGVFGQIT